VATRSVLKPPDPNFKTDGATRSPVPPDGRPPDPAIAVAGGKGGCGKTTAVLGLAAALVALGHRPVAVDADVHLPDLHIRAGVARQPGLASLLDGHRPARVTQESPRHPGVSVVAAGTPRIATHRPLSRVTSRLARPVLLDCPAGAGPDAVDPLRVADGTVIVATETRRGRTDAAKTARMARSLDAAPVAWIERAVASRGEATAPSPPTDLPAVTLPHVRNDPLQHPTVVKRFRRIARAIVASSGPGR